MATVCATAKSVVVASSPLECAFCYEPVTADFGTYGVSWWAPRSDGGSKTGVFCAKKTCVARFCFMLEEISTETRGGEVMCTLLGQWSEELGSPVVSAAMAVETHWAAHAIAPLHGSDFL